MKQLLSPKPVLLSVILLSISLLWLPVVYCDTFELTLNDVELDGINASDTLNLTIDGYAVNPNGSVVLQDNLYSLEGYPIWWYDVPVNLSTADLSPLFQTYVESINSTTTLQQVTPLVYRLSLLDEIPTVIYFGGRTNYSFVCDPELLVTRVQFNCYSYTSEGIGSVIGTFLALTNNSAGLIVSSAVSTSSTNYGYDLLSISCVRLTILSPIRYSMLTVYAPGNNARRQDSKTPVGFAFFFIVLAMVAIVAVVTLLLGWMFPIFPRIPTTPYKLLLHNLIWFAIIFFLCLIITLAAKLPGWVILGAIYIVVIIILTGFYFKDHMKKVEENSEIEMSSSKTEGSDTVLYQKFFSRRPYRMGRTQACLTICWSCTFALSLVCIGICWAGWSTSNYYVWDRTTNVAVVEIQPASVSKSTLAFYSFDGVALTVNLNFFLVIFTDWCGHYYNENLTFAEQYDRIYVNYVELYQIDMNMFTPSNWTAYPTLNAFFIRNLAPGSRPIAQPDNNAVMVAPADARYFLLELLPQDFEILLKEENYNMNSLLGSSDLGQMFTGGSLIIARLAPQDYHQYHAPISGTVISRTPLKGTIFSVNADAVRSADAVYMNERVVTIVQTEDFGQVAFVAVGATCIGSIVDNFDVGSVWTKGDKIGKFEYGGSTVLVFLQPGSITWDDDIAQYSDLGVETLIHVNTQIGVAAAS